MSAGGVGLATTTDALKLFRDEVARLAQGGKPDNLDLEVMGDYAPYLQQMYQVYSLAGVDGVKSYLGRPEVLALLSGEAEKPRYKLMWARDALQPQPPIDWIVEGVVSAGSTSVIMGDAGCGKTWLTLDLAVAVASNADAWLGYKLTGGPVLIVDEESGPRRLARRLADVLRGHNAGPQTPLAYTTLNRFDLWKPEDADAIMAATREVGARLVVLDALMDLLPGRDENSVKDVLPGLLALRDVAEATNAALVVIHHANKSGGYRGSSSIKGEVDTMLEVTKDGNLLKIRHVKARDVEEIRFSALMNFDHDLFNLSPAAETADDAPALFTKGERFVLRYLAEHGASETTTMARAADSCSPETARRAVYALADKKLVARADDGGPGSLATYKLTPAGEAVCAGL